MVAWGSLSWSLRTSFDQSVAVRKRRFTDQVDSIASHRPSNRSGKHEPLKREISFRSSLANLLKEIPAHVEKE